MIYNCDINQLISEWNKRMTDTSYDPSYHDALNDCIYELNNLLSKSIEEELTYQDYLEMEADSYLASQEAHEYVA